MKRFTSRIPCVFHQYAGKIVTPLFGNRSGILEPALVKGLDVLGIGAVEPSRGLLVVVSHDLHSDSGREKRKTPFGANAPSEDKNTERMEKMAGLRRGFAFFGAYIDETPEGLLQRGFA